MALTVGTITHKSAKALQMNNVVFTTLDLDASYPSGGYDCDAVLNVVDKLPNYEILHIEVMSDGSYTFGYDHVNNKLLVFDAATGAEIADTTNLAAVTGLQATIFCQ